MSLYAVLGETELEVIQWLDGFEAKFAAEWPEQGLIGRKSLIQHTGFKPDEVRIDVLLHAQWCDPGAELVRLKARLDAAEPMAFVLGTGEYRGVFVLTDIETTTRQTDGAGALMALEARLTLKECVGDPAEPNPPAVLLPGWQAPVADGVDVVDVPIATVFADSPVGDLAETVSAAVAGASRVADVAGQVASLASLARVAPASALALAPSVAGALAGAADALPVDALSGVARLADAASAAQAAVSQLQAAASVLDGAGPADILWRAQSAASGAQYALRALEGGRRALASLVADIAIRSAVA